MINQGELERRLDPFYYIPELVKLDLAIKAKTKYRLKDFTLFRASGATPQKSNEDYYSDKEKGVPFIRVQNLSTTGELDLNDLIHISVDTHEGLLKRSQIKEHDLLIKITGVGRMAIASIVPDGFEGNINQHIVVVRTGSKELSQNLAAFLNLDSAEKIATKRATGGTRPALDYSSLFSIPVINDRDIYLRIQEAVEAKKAKEAEAQRFLDSIDTYLLGKLGIELPEEGENTLEERVFFRPISELSGNRLDSNPYRSERLEAIANIGKGIYATQPLHHIVSFKTDKVNFIEQGITYIGLENVESKTGRWIPAEWPKDSISSAAIFNKGDILFPKLRPYLNKVFFPDWEGVCSTEFHVLHSEVANNEYIAHFLRSQIVVSQTKHLMTGNTLPRLQLKDIQKLLIPTPPIEIQEELVTQISIIREQIRQLQQQAVAELTQAKQAIEAIILGG